MESVNFGSSQFKGKEGLAIDFRRGKPVLLLLFLLLPSCVFFTFLIQVDHNNNDDNNNNSVNYPSIPIQDLGPCDVYSSSKCIRVVYGPNDLKSQAIMKEFSFLNDLSFGKDVKGFETVDLAQEFVASHIGEVQFTIFFQNKSLWETSSYSPYYIPLPKNLAYTIFYNSSRNHDSRSKQYGVNFPLLVLQKTLEESYLRLSYGTNFDRYDVNYGEIWDYPYSARTEVYTPENITNTNTTKCDLSSRKRSFPVGIAMPWVLVFVMLCMSSITFQIIADERRKQLFTFLRRLGLFDIAYWLSWFITFQILLIISCTISLISAAFVLPYSDMLRAIDLKVMFLLLYLSGSGTISLSFFLSSFCYSSSISSSLAFTQFLVALAIVTACINPFNYYEYADTDDDNGDDGAIPECYLVSSSYNSIYSPMLPGASFVQFLVFFLPYFHSAQTISDIISIVRYEHLEIKIDHLGSPKELVSMSGSDKTYDSYWIGYSLRLLAVNTFFYLFCSWLASQLLSTGASEGRPLISVLIPPFLRRYIKQNEKIILQDGDIRGEEKEKSKLESSVRAYKVSKTYSGVQALKEVSFTMKKGEVFVLLGHNGAGKSTLINIITGVTKPTHGKVFLNGFDIEEDIAEIQQTIGVCSQDDYLWDELTAKEHMILTAIFKGIKWGSELKQSVENVLNLVQLTDRSNEFCRQYSGGMKRRLSVAMSTVGDVEILFLDEPTTGLDPVSRRRVWEAINIMKKNRVVVLTTHNMEEADFLADTIMIMHSGHVRAFGDPLFLKQTFGKGYQVNMQILPDSIQEATNIIMNLLPDATCIMDENSMMMNVTVPKVNAIGLPRLFTWLESSRRASTIIKEWGVSNTTLEQVFLMLCIQNTEINMGIDPNQIQNNNINNNNQNNNRNNNGRDNLCPMCHIRPRENVILRNMNQETIIIPDSICWECSINNSHYKLNSITDGDNNNNDNNNSNNNMNEIDIIKEQNLIKYLIEEQNQQQRQIELQKLIKKAQINAENEIAQKILSQEKDEETKFDDALWNQESENESLLLLENSHNNNSNNNNEINHNHFKLHAVPENNNNMNKIVSPHQIISIETTSNMESGQLNNSNSNSTKRENWGGTTSSQIHAVIVKNAVLQSRQRCSNICSAFLVVALFGVLYLIGFLFKQSQINQCSEGYLTEHDCSTKTIVDHIFSGSQNTMTDDYAWDDDEVGPYGYNIKGYLVPSQSGVILFGKNPSTYSVYGFYYYPNRNMVIWSTYSQTPTLQSAPRGLYYYYRNIPNTSSSTINEPNINMYNTQKLAYEGAFLNTNYPECINEEYTENTLIGNYLTSSYTIQQLYSNTFADLVLSCLECYDKHQTNPEKFYFNGTLWVGHVTTKDSCNKQSCKRYPYGYINFKSSSLSPNTNYFDNDKCPDGVYYFDMNSYPNNDKSQTFQAMTSLNFLTNTIIDPNLGNYTIQGGCSPYGDLNFDATGVSQGQSNILTVIAMFLLNGFWPLAVWRLSHERSQELVLMMRTVGMKTISYISGMFLFDMIISVFSGISMVIFAVLLNLTQFKGAPISDLVAIVLLSSFALNAMALLIVQLFGKKSTILPLLAPCLCVVATAFTSLLNVFLYPDDGDWPWGLSIIPFLAQGRALYIILVYHQSSQEVVIAYVLLILFGIISLIVVYILEADIPVIVYITLTFKRLFESSEEKEFRKNQFNIDSNINETQLNVISNNNNNNNVNVNAINGKEKRKKVYKTFEGFNMDEDVINEKEIALKYILPQQSLQQSLQQTQLSINDKFAIVIQNLRHIFPNGTIAVKELSLALSYGECFGLLGPNGTGKSTTISILSGTLRASMGNVYVAGSNIEHDTTAIHRYVGICPQFDIVWKDLTVAEHLTFQARQRGIPSHRMSAEVQKAAISVGLDGDGFYTKAGDLSGGMRRRLSIAMSVVGNPPIIFMDEPTTGLDPDNKNHVWSIIQSLKSPDRLILMTTHSMEEAEALCSRIGIMARGELQCIGTSQHLKKKYGKGYTLTVNLLKYNSNVVNNVSNNNNNIELLLNENEREQRYDNETEKKLIEYVTGSLSFGHGKLLSSINRTKKFLLPKEIGSENNVLHISHIFKEMEMNKNLLNIREWGLSMSTLEDVFISAVKNTHEEDDGEKEKENLSLEKSYLNMKTNLETKDSIEHDSQKLLENSSLSIESSKSERERFQL